MIRTRKLTVPTGSDRETRLNDLDVVSNFTGVPEAIENVAGSEVQ